MSEPSISVLLRKSFCCLFIFFCAFPFVRIISFGGYTQPYALLVACILLPVTIKVLIRKGAAFHFLYFISFALIGVTLFLIMCFPYTNAQEYKYLISYVGFPLTAIATLYFADKERALVKRLIEISVLIWLFVALVQALYHPAFLTSLIGLHPDMGRDMLVSGRGVLSLAPEPTHYGFHMLMFAAALSLLDEKRRYVLLCIFQAVFLAKSASAFMAIALGSALAILASRRVRLRTAFLATVSTTILFFVVMHLYPHSRITILLDEFMEHPLDILQRDASLNFRLGGLFATFAYIIDNYILPHGLAHSSWLETAEIIRSNNSWLIDISLVGPPSGIGVLLFQCGILILPHVFFMLFVILRASTTGLGSMILYCSVFIIFSQYYIASPPFALVFALALAKGKKSRGRPPTAAQHDFDFQQPIVMNRIAL